jgi:hypothetical protein
MCIFNFPNKYNLYYFCCMISHLNKITWVKVSSRNKIASGNGYYLQHQKEYCLVGIKVCNILNLCLKLSNFST